MSVSFSFAKRNGVFIERTDDGRASVVCRPDASATAILEACRVAAIDSDFREVAAGEFDRLLQSVYESADGAENGQAMASISMNSPDNSRNRWTCWKARTTRRSSG